MTSEPPANEREGTTSSARGRSHRRGATTHVRVALEDHELLLALSEASGLPPRVLLRRGLVLLQQDNALDEMIDAHKKLLADEARFRARAEEMDQAKVSALRKKVKQRPKFHVAQ